MSWSVFPPRTDEIQFDEKWAFVYKKEKHCDPLEEKDQHRGDNWDHVAFDPTHRLVLEVVPGKRSRQGVRQVVQAAKRRTGGRILRLLTSDEFSAYREEILSAYGVQEPAPANPDALETPKPCRHKTCFMRRCIRHVEKDGWLK